MQIHCECEGKEARVDVPVIRNYNDFIQFAEGCPFCQRAVKNIRGGASRELALMNALVAISVTMGAIDKLGRDHERRNELLEQRIETLSAALRDSAEQRETRIYESGK